MFLTARTRSKEIVFALKSRFFKIWKFAILRR